MRFRCIRILLSVILTTALFPIGLDAQNIKFRQGKVTVGKAIDEIKRQAGLSVDWSGRIVDTNRTISVNEGDNSLDSVMQSIVGNELDWSLSGRHIIITAPNRTVSTADGLQTDGDLDIRGIVVDTQDPPEPVVGATVYIKGTSKGAAVDVSGFFSIKARKGDVLVFSCIGFKDIEFTVRRSMANLSIAMPEDVNVLDQAVVTGMTSQQRKHIASAVGIVNSDNFRDKPVTNLSQALQGGTTGILVSQGSGEPGADNTSIKIRGVASLVGAKPLVLVDGFEFDMNKLDPSTVESVTILKDAAAASIYGAKAGGGVILITTRRGTAGTVKVGYNGYAGVQQILYMPKIADSWDYMTYANQAAANSGSSRIYSDAEIDMAKTGADPILYPNTDWADLLIKEFTNITEHNFSVSGGNTTGRFALSAQYLSQEGIYKARDNGFDRFTVRANTSVNMTKDILMFVDMFVGRDTRQTLKNVYGSIYSTPRNIVGKYPPKEGSRSDYYGFYIGSTINALADLERAVSNTYVRDYVTINARPQWNISPGLTLKGQIGYRLSTGMDKQNRNPYVFFNYFTGAEMLSYTAIKTVSYTTRSTYWSAGANLDWVKEFGHHRINLLGGWSSEVNATSGWDNIALVSGYGKAYYSLKDKYLFEAGIRADGSSLFASGRKWGLFPSVAAGWNVNKESFLKDVKNLDVLKLRVSFGMLGNNNVSPYSYQSLINASTAVETKIGNPDLRWETVKISDAGLDLSLFNYAVDFTFDVFNKDVTDLIMSLPATPSSALLSTPANVGNARTRGFEIGLSVNKEVNEDVKLSISGGFSFNKSKWVYMPGGTLVSGNTIYVQGGPLFANYFYVADGLLTQEDLDNYVAIVGGYPDNGVLAQAPGDIKYIDQNGDGVIDNDDKVPVGDREPHSIYYSNLTFRYKNFDFDTQITGQGRSNGFYYDYFIQPLNNSYQGAVQTMQLDYWTPEHTDARYPRPTISGSTNEYLSTFWMFNRAFARVKYIQVGYSFPKLARRLHASKIRIYGNVQNAFTFSDLKVSDPETCSSNNGGAVTSKYPIFRTFTAGLNLGF